MTSLRQRKLEEQFHRVVADIISHCGCKVPVTIKKVGLNSDLSMLTVHIDDSLRGIVPHLFAEEQKGWFQALKQQEGMIRGKLAKTLSHMKKIPQVRLVLDE